LMLTGRNKFDVIITDIIVPKINGLEFCKKLRENKNYTPVIMLTALGLTADKLRGFDSGSDDYLVKPFSIEELLLKIEIFLMRSKKNRMNHTLNYTIGNYAFNAGDYSLNPITLGSDSRKVTLTQRESELLKFFLDNRNRVLKREEILKSLWGDDDYFMGRSLDVFISRLRKILSTEKGVIIENLHGIGFRFSMAE